MNKLLVFLLLWGCSTQHKRTPVTQKTKSVATRKLIELDHQYFKIGYDPKLRLAHYVSYDLTADQLKSKRFKRKNKFKTDPLLQQQGLPFVESSEYLRSGYDRGHLAPAADFSWSEEASDRTFVMSNMAPQKPALNRKAWKKLEDQVRRWACGEKRITVITGPLLDEARAHLKSGLKIPPSFYKVIIDQTPPRKIISFIYHQEDSDDGLERRLVSLAVLQNKVQLVSTLIPDSFRAARIPASLKEWKEEECFARR